MMPKFYIFVAFVLFATYSFAQDVHFTQYEMTPTHVNPANTGGFYGSYRIGGIYRDQSLSATGGGNQFRTPHLYIDATFPYGLRKKDWIGFGLNGLQDKSGTIDLGRTLFQASAAYHFALGKTSRSDIALGIQWGSVNFGIGSKDKAKFYDQLKNNGTSNDLAKLQDKTNYQDYTVGLAYTSKMTSKNHIVRVGLNASHVNKPTVSVVQAGAGTGGSSTKLPMLLTANAGVEYHYTEKLDIIPMLWFRSIDKPSEAILQCMGSYLFNIEKQIRLNGGLGYRFGDAIQFMVGANVGKIKAQLGYDFVTSGKSAAESPLGGVEFAISYIGVVNKKPNPKPKVFCPRF
ncbi:MAG: PorP/SprF family type IX secretion system membrane protein [Saprospiraceae bacterium]|nr:PorP/SprF family type IX secretion system membrane protein [Saprospiraceae bacterium]